MNIRSSRTKSVTRKGSSSCVNWYQEAKTRLSGASKEDFSYRIPLQVLVHVAKLFGRHTPEKNTNVFRFEPGTDETSEAYRGTAQKRHNWDSNPGSYHYE